MTINIEKNEEKPNLKLFCEVTKNSYGCFDLDNTFEVFNSVNDILMLVYSTKSKSIICYDLGNFCIITEIKNCHNAFITNIRHFFDNLKKIDIIISISDRDNNLKLWDINNCECILNIAHANNNGFLCSAYIINENNNIYAISSNCNMMGESEKIKIFDLEGKIINQINDSNEKTYFLDTFYDKFIDKLFILTGNADYIKSYDYKNNYLHKKYFDIESGIHISIKILQANTCLSLVESSSFGFIRIWNFYSGELLNKIKVDNDWIFGICLWNKDYAFVACKLKIIKLVNLTKGLIEKNLEGHFSGIFTIKKIIHQKYGECLLSQGYENDQIKLWAKQGN